MKVKHTSRIAPVLLATVIALGIAMPAAAESAAELLEKGIYTEQTVGDLKAAIKIYTRIVENDEASRPQVAQAQFRLGMCYLKRGRDAQARVALDTLIDEFPEQARLVAQAREQIAAAQPALALGPVPWEDGEFLEYQIRLPTGKVVGYQYLMAESTVVDGLDAWRLEQRSFGPGGSGVSRVLVDRYTQRPISSTVRNQTLGHADATYGPDGVQITGGGTDTHVDSDQEVYANEQSMQLLRMLPLEPGYKAEISFLPTWTAVVAEIGLEVTGIEGCQVPAGDFDCYALDLDVGNGQDNQTFWYSTGPERYPLKIKAEGVIIELVEIGRSQSGAPIPFGMEGFGFSGTLPAGWWLYVHSQTNQAALRLLDPDAQTISLIGASRCPKRSCPSLQETAELELAGARSRSTSYEMRQGSWTERTIDGRPAISFVGDYLRNGTPWVEYRLYTFTSDAGLELIFKTPVDRFEGLRAAFDSVVENLETE